MRFSEAFDELVDGNRVRMRLPHWRRDIALVYCVIDKKRMLCINNGRQTKPYIPSQAELFSEEWFRDSYAQEQPKEEDNLLI